MSDLEILQAKQDIAELCYKYGLILDARDWPRLREVFTEDAVADYLDMPLCEGRQAIEDTCATAFGPLDATQHLIANVVVTVRGDEADAVCYLQAQHVKTDTEGGDNFIIAGKYTDQVVRTPDGWRIKHRRLDAMWTQGNPKVVGA